MFYIFFLLLSFGNLGRISFAGQQINFTLVDIYLAFLFFLGFARFRLKPIVQSIKLLRPLYFFLGWLILTFLISSANFTTQENLVGSLYLLRLILYFAFFIFLSFTLLHGKRGKTAFRKGTTVFIVATFFISVVQYFLYPNLRNISYLGWDPHQGRVFGTFLDTSATASLFGLALLYLLFNKRRLGRIIWYLLTAGFVALSLLTYSRGFYLAIFITGAFYLVTGKKFKILLALVLFLAVTILILPRQTGEGTNLLRTFSISSRIEDQKKAVMLVVKNPMFGVGYNHLRYVRDSKNPLLNQPESHAAASFHSSFLIIAATSGIVGLGLFIWLLYKLSTISEASKYYVIFLSIFSLFDNIILYPLILIYALTLLAGEVKKGVIFQT